MNKQFLKYILFIVSVAASSSLDIVKDIGNGASFSTVQRFIARPQV